MHQPYPMKNTKNVRWCILALAICSRLWSADQPTTGIIMTTAAMNYSWHGATVERVELTPEGEMHIYYRQPSNIILTSNPPIVPPDSHWKEIYGVKDGKIVLLRRVDAKVTPATPPHVEWPK